MQVKASPGFMLEDVGDEQCLKTEIYFQSGKSWHTDPCLLPMRLLLATVSSVVVGQEISIYFHCVFPAIPAMSILQFM